MCFGALPVNSQNSMELTMKASDPFDFSDLPGPEALELLPKKKKTYTLAQYIAIYGPIKENPEAEANRKRMVEDMKRQEAQDDSHDASKRSDGTKRKIMSHDNVVHASYGHQIPYFQKFFIQENERPTMARLAARAHQSLELRKTVGAIYEKSTPCNSNTPMFFDFGPCPWMQDVKDTPKLDPVKENQRFIEKAERIKAKQQQEKQLADKIQYGHRLISAVMMKGTTYRGGLPEYLASLPQEEQLHIMETIAFNQQHVEKQEKAKANGGIGIAYPRR